MDSAYDCDLILAHSEQLGHVPVVQPHPRRRKRRATQLPVVLATQYAPELSWAQQERYRERTSVERVFARLKDEFGGRYVRVRGAKKVMAYLLMSAIALTVAQLVRWAATALTSDFCKWVSGVPLLVPPEFLIAPSEHGDSHRKSRKTGASGT